MTNLIKLRRALEKSWGKSTTYCIDKFNKRKPALGQCLVSSLVIQHYMGGQLVRGTYESPKGEIGSHYWLRFDKIDVDLTWEQFPKGTEIRDIQAVTREGMLKYSRVKDRYNILLGRVEQQLLKKRRKS